MQCNEDHLRYEQHLWHEDQDERVDQCTRLLADLADANGFEQDPVECNLVEGVRHWQNIGGINRSWPTCSGQSG